MSGKPRLRFAPSPTGYLHLGGARTALFNWLIARKLGGTFVLRIEDTDQARSTEESTAAIFDGLRYLGLDWDEGPLKGGDYGPYVQTERKALYREHAERLIAGGKAYRCRCSQAELDLLREAAAEANVQFRYPGTCRDQAVSEDEDYVVRIKMPELGSTTFEDLVRGRITTPHETLQDEVILRKDGVPLYNFGCVVDDATMEIDVVARGDDHINNTARQILMYQALGYEPPKFAHLPMILGDDKKRLSKRHGAVSVSVYRDLGYLPHAMVNYLVRLGWSLDDKTEVFSLEDLLEHFDFSRVSKSAAVFNPEKLTWLNQHWIKESEPSALAPEIVERLAGLGFEASADEKLLAIIAALQPRVGTLQEMAESATVYYRSGVESWDEKAVKKFLDPKFRPQLQAARDQLAGLDPYDAEAMEEWARGYAEANALGLGKVAQPLRVALVGGTASPGIFETIAMVGRDEALARIDTALGMMDAAGEA
ncbi:MAG: glutamate--tRNA ligase [Deltaproteobacteria bacterium]|nr:glutamate--tRNA ligase [Deltaproteobacteria bacterium]